MKIKNNRIEYVDRLRGLAVVAMFFVHSAGAWLSATYRSGPYYKMAMRISGTVAPTFMFLAGISICLVAWRGQASGQDSSKLKQSIFKRGAKILILGYLLHLCFWMCDGFGGHWSRILKVDILHCIGLGLMIFPYLAWPRGRVNWPALALFLGLPILGHLLYCLPGIDNWPVGLLSYFSTKPKLALFPFVPYAAWIALGLFVGPFWVSSLGDSKKERGFWIGFILATVAVFFAAKGVKSLFYSSGLHNVGGEIPMTRGIFHVFLSKSALVFFLFFVSWATRSIFDQRGVRILTFFGKVSLFAYAVHLFFVYNSIGDYLLGALTPLQHVLGAAGLSIGMYVLCRLWKRYPPVWIRERLRKALAK